MPALSLQSFASSLKKAPRKLFKRNGTKTKMTISSPFNVTITSCPLWLKVAAEEIIEPEPEALTSAEILEHLRVSLPAKLAAAEQQESDNVDQRSPKFVPKLGRIFELTERRCLGEVSSAKEQGQVESSADEDLFTPIISDSDSDSDVSSTPSTPTTERYSSLFDTPSPQSSPASSVSSLPLPAEHVDIAKRLFTSASATTTSKVDSRTTSRIPRLTLKSSTSTIGLGLALSLPQDLRSSAEQVFGPFRPQRSPKSRSADIYRTTLIPAPTVSSNIKPRPSSRRSPSFSRKLGAPLTSLPPRVFPISRTPFGRVSLSNESSIGSPSLYRRGRCGVPVRRA
ncbi:hypothetical protein BCR35DRAFT_334446 [Leucosporidium creatinivorum]|uniref:Uncharacterized protein n=1 Tax=Leucosporidium creatinivorum TaxID=106004 RepID=A0A1Y2E8R0_9BASI|nr:hypothetical protein BCR35DRAFT_334446 [Leucosporidium creatinivorum]